jgi:hypothetical protein
MGEDGPYTSQSMRPVLSPIRARPAARLVETVDFPTPPLPEATTKIELNEIIIPISQIADLHLVHRTSHFLAVSGNEWNCAVLVNQQFDGIVYLMRLKFKLGCKLLQNFDHVFHCDFLWAVPVNILNVDTQGGPSWSACPDVLIDSFRLFVN